MIGEKKRNDIQLIGTKKRDAMMIGSKHKSNKAPLVASQAVQDTSVAQQKSALERMKKTGHNLGIYG